LAKKVFHIHGRDLAGRSVVERSTKRKDFLETMAKLPPSVVGLEACGSAHHWGRHLGKQGHEVKLIPPKYVKPYVRRQKNDKVDAAAICEAVSRPHMRFTLVKSEEQQAQMMVHGTRDLLMGQRTAQINALRGRMAEFGVVAPKGTENVEKLSDILADLKDARIPALARDVLQVLADLIAAIEESLAKLGAIIAAQHKGDPNSRRVAEIPGIGVLNAHAICAQAGDIETFKRMIPSGRDFAAFLGLVPRQNSTGGKTTLGRITRMGNKYIRSNLVLGARAVLARIETGKPTPLKRWALKLLARKPRHTVEIALANKLARIAWAVLVKGERYDGNLLEASVGPQA
jgi:transposase